MTQDDPARALNAPFTLPAEWDPIPGRCSRCNRPALLSEGRWWHDGPSCTYRYGNTAEFLPDPT